MKNKVIVLIVSVIIAIIILCVGIYGAKKVKSGDSKSSEKDSSVNEINSDNTDEKDTSDSEADTSDEIEQSTPEATSEESTTSESDKYINNNIDPSKPMVALTFDDGPGGENTSRILDALKAHNGHATFFVVGYNIDGHEDLMKRVAEEGSEIGNHTTAHEKLTALDAAGINGQIEPVENRVKEITGQERVIIRPPYGAVDDNVMSVLNSPVILWSIDTEDWKTRDANSTIANVQANVYDGAIILMHDIYSQTADAAVTIIEWLDSQGYQMVTVSELGYYRRGGLQTGVKYGSLAPN